MVSAELRIEGIQFTCHSPGEVESRMFAGIALQSLEMSSEMSNGGMCDASSLPEVGQGAHSQQVT